MADLPESAHPPVEPTSLLEALDPTSKAATKRRQPARMSKTTTHLPPSRVEKSSGRRRPSAKKDDSVGSPHSGSSREGSATMHRSPSITDEQSRIQYTETGRIKKAKKGLRVHTCAICGKVYTRNEHLKRHQLNHNTEEELRCDIPGCGRTFFRRDLLVRHKERHNETGNESGPLFPATTPPAYAETDPMVTASLGGVPVPVTAPDTNIFEPFPASLATAFSSLTQPAPSSKNTFPNNQSRIPISISIPSEGAPCNPYDLQFPDSWIASPNYPSSASGMGSPRMDAAYQGFSGQHLMSDLPRARAPSNASFIDAWNPMNGFSSRSPISATSSGPPFWTDLENSPRHQSSSTPSGSDSSLYNLPGTFGTIYDSWLPYQAPRQVFTSDWDALENATLFGIHQNMAEDLALQLYSNYELYYNNYWLYFHPTFPVVHKPTFNRHDAAPLLKAAMLAIGAQYSEDWSDKDSSRRLHEKCVKLIKKRTQDSNTFSRTCDMQAVFLIEVLTQFRSRRACQRLSHQFNYCQIALSQENETGFSVPWDNLTSLSSVQTTHSQWLSWIQLHSKQRLMLAYYILDTQQALLFNRPDRLGSVDGLQLPFPCSTGVWNAQSPDEWSLLAAQETHGAHDVYEVFSSAIPSQPSLDQFQSALVVAVHCSINLSPVFGNAHPEGQPPEASESIILSLLPFDPQTRLFYHAAKMCQYTPIRTLLAVGGESWVMGEKLVTEDQFVHAKADLRQWATATSSGAKQPADPMNTTSTMAAIDQAVSHALQVTSIAFNNKDHETVRGLHTEWCLYLATLVLWAAAAAARPMSSDATVSNIQYPLFTPHAAHFPSVEPSDALDALLDNPLNNPTTGGSSPDTGLDESMRIFFASLPQPANAFDAGEEYGVWELQSVLPVIQWSKRRIGGMNPPLFGGLINEAVGVLGKLGNGVTGGFSGWF